MVLRLVRIVRPVSCGWLALGTIKLTLVSVMVCWASTKARCTISGVTSLVCWASRKSCCKTFSPAVQAASGPAKWKRLPRLLMLILRRCSIIRRLPSNWPCKLARCWVLSGNRLNVVSFLLPSELVDLCVEFLISPIAARLGQQAQARLTQKPRVHLARNGETPPK